MKNRFNISMRLFIALILAQARAMPAAAAQNALVLNEFVADNTSYADTTDKTFDDWVEVYNSGNETIHLVNYYLTDTKSLPCQWKFPDISIAPKQFLLVWADNDKDLIGLHANFKLSKSGEFLGIYAVNGPDTVAVDSVSFGVQVTNVSMGRYPDGTGSWHAMSVPSPQAANKLDKAVDYTGLVFDESKIHKWELHFFTPNWPDSLEYYYQHGEVYMPAQLKYEGFVFDTVGVRYKGNSSYMMSRNSIKKPLKVKFNKYRKGQTIYGLKEINFSNCVKDPSFMREKLAYDIARKIMPAPRAVYANLYVDGALIGLYVQVEQVDELFLTRYYKDVTGNLYKASDAGTTLEYLGPDSSKYTAGLELKTNEDENNWSGIINMFDLLNNAPAATFSEIMSKELDLDLCCRLLAFNMVLSNFDSYTGSGRNFYLYDDPISGQFQMLPWDLNEAFGAYTNNWNVVTLDIVNTNNLQVRPLARRILENTTWRGKYLGYIQKMITGPAAADSVAVEVAKWRSFLDSYVQADQNKMYSYNQFLQNLSNTTTISMGITVPGIISFSTSRNSNLTTQLQKYGTAVVSDNTAAPATFQLYQNYPNPFNPSTTISYSIPLDGHVFVRVYDILGKEVTALVDKDQMAGQYSAVFSGLSLASGVYLVRCSAHFAGGRTMVREQKMLLLK
jgi:spore coat protein CotH